MNLTERISFVIFLVICFAFLCGVLYMVETIATAELSLSQ